MWSHIVQLWESLQVELHGKYSNKRVLELSNYASNTSWLHVITVLIVTPLPCILVIVLADILPLADPADGVSGNTLFFLRNAYTTFVQSFICIHQFRISVPILPYPIRRAIVNALYITVGDIGIQYAVASSTSFPLPFSLVTTTLPWITLVTISMTIEWRKKIRETPGAKVMLTNVMKVMACQVALETLYPIYYCVFQMLSDEGQMGFALLLPVIKLALRYVFTRTVVHLTDEMPEVIVFNVEVFNALFVSYCMQNSPSVWTTLGLMFVDIVLIILSVHDMEPTSRGLKELEQRIDRERCWNKGTNTGNRVPTTLDRIQTLLEQESSLQYMVASARVELEQVQTDLGSERRVPEQIKSGRNKISVTPVVTTKIPNNAELLPVASHLRASARIHPAVESAGKLLQKFSVKVRYTRKVQILLYMAEFLLLLNYVEVVVPLVFSVYMLATYQLPNREYYSQLHGMTQSDLLQTLGNVMFYCSLQLASLLLLVFILQRKLDLSPIHQLSFVLEKQYSAVQAKLVFWVLFTTQASLQHN
ncbi:hypothetical protein L916_12387, partial [Phytophthora nicotianae]